MELAIGVIVMIGLIAFGIWGYHSYGKQVANHLLEGEPNEDKRN